MNDGDRADVVVRDDPDSHSYIVEVDGVPAGKAVYHLRGGRHLFVHTEVDPSVGGRGVGAKLVRGALDDVRAQGGVVVPICPFFVSYLKRHPEYEDLIDREMTDRINKSR